MKTPITRREFAKGLAAAAVAAPWIVPASARGVDGAVAPSNRIGIGMIGMGRQAYYSNLPFFLEASDAQVLAVNDVDQWRLDNALNKTQEHYAQACAQETWRGCLACRDFHEILERPDVDAVMISTPDHWHVPMAIAAARAGKDICLEKPITLSIAEGRALCDAVQRHGRVFRTDSEFRSHGFFHRAVELVRNGRIGALHTIRTGAPAGDIACGPQPAMDVPEELDYAGWLGPAPEAPYTEKRVHPPSGYGRPGWMRLRDYCEGMITNWGTHLNDIAQWGNDSDRTGPVEVEATGRYPDDGLWDVLLSFEAHYRYADGVRLIYTMDRPFVRFEGDEGWIEADYNSQRLTASADAILTSRIASREMRFPLMHEKRDFLDAVKLRSRTLADAEVGHRTTSLCQIAHIAIQVGRPLRWDPDREVFPGDEEANRLLHRSYRSPWGL